MQPARVCYAAIVKHSAVARQDNAMLVERNTDDFGIIVVRTVEGIETQQSQNAGKLAKMDVQDKRSGPQWGLAQLDDGGNVEALKHGIDRCPIAMHQLVVEPY